MVLLPLLPVSAGMARSRPGFAQGVSLADVCYGLSSHSLRDATAALLKASGRWCSPGPADGVVRLGFLQQCGRWRKLAKGGYSGGHEGSQGLLDNFPFHWGHLCSLDGAASSHVSFAYVFVCVRASVCFPYFVIYVARIVIKNCLVLRLDEEKSISRSSIIACQICPQSQNQIFILFNP